jgi:hypothetical protein
MRVWLGLAVAVVAACPSAVASAQHPAVLAKLQELNAQAPQPAVELLKAQVAQTAKSYGQANGTCVPKEIVIREVAAVTGARDILQGVLSGEIRNGWVVYATHGGCPGNEPFRYLVAQKSDGTLLAPLVNEGRTFANPSIMRDTSASAALAALQKAKQLDSSCTGETMKMGVTRIAKQSSDLGADTYGVRYTGSWSEIWRFHTCGRTLDVPVEFRADGDGGAYTNIKGEEVAVVQ